MFVSLFFLGSWPAREQLFYRILLGSWSLAVLVLVNAYSSLLISYLTIPTLMPAAKNYDDLVFNPIFKNLGSIAEKNSIKLALISRERYLDEQNYSRICISSTRPWRVEQEGATAKSPSQIKTLRTSLILLTYFCIRKTGVTRTQLETSILKFNLKFETKN